MSEDVQITDASGNAVPGTSEDLFSEEELSDPGEASLATPPVTETDEDDTTMVEASDEDDAAIQRLIARHGSDPQKLAKALLHFRRVASRQGNELSAFKQSQRPSDPAPELFPVEEDPLPAPDVSEEDQPTPVEDAAKTTWTPEVEPTVETFDWEPKDPNIFYKEGDPIDETSGWPLDQDGDPYQPMNVYGVLYTPESRWQQRSKELSAHYPDNPAYAAQVLMQEKQADAARVFEESKRNFAVRNQQQEVAAAPYVEKIAVRLGKDYPEPVAKALAESYKEEAKEIIREALRTNQIHPLVQVSKGLLAQVTQKVWQKALEDDTIREDAQEIYSRIRPQGTAPIGAAKNGSGGRALNGRPAPAPASRNGSVAAAPILSMEEDPLVRSGFLSADESKKLEGKTFTFGD